MSTTIDRQVALANEITAILRERVGYHEQFAAPIAEAIVHGLTERRGGDLLYVPTGRRSGLQSRNSAIRLEFNGRNCKQLCQKYDIGRSTLYKIVGSKSEGRG